MKHYFFNHFLVPMLLFCFVLNGGELQESVLDDHEFGLLEQNPTVRFVYIPEPIRLHMLRACKDMQDLPANNFWTDLKDGAHIVPIDDLMQELSLIHNYFNDPSLQGEPEHQLGRALFLEYLKLIESGEAIITFDDISRSGSRVLNKLIVKCQLIAGSLRVCGNIFVCGDIIGPNGTFPTQCQCPVRQNNYLFAYSTAAQPVAVVNTYQTTTFNVVGLNNGWITVGAPITGFTAINAGIYQVTFTATAQRITGGSAAQRIFEMRALVDGVPIPGSQMHIQVVTTNLNTIITNTFQVTLRAGSTISLQLAAGQTNSQIIGATTAGSTVNPSVTISMHRLE